ncbi:MAG: CPBP family intramembrane glutamic endopeptidase [Bacteroidota bacterium]
MDFFPTQNLKPWAQMLWFLAIVFVVMLFTYLLGLVLAVPLFGKSIAELQTVMSGSPTERSVSMLLYFQFISQMGIFVLPPLLFAILIKKNVFYYFQLDKSPNPRSLLFSFLIAFTILPAINILAQWNQQLNLPELFQSTQQWMEVREETAKELTELFLNRTSWQALMSNLLFIAVIPAIGEELFFRGVLQKTFSAWFRNPHAGIILTAVLFSALHMQFFGFLPRFVLGLLFGYYFYWSRSLWLPVFAHFINNGAAVLVAFLAARGKVDINYEEFGSYNSNAWLVAIYTIITLVLLYFIYYQSRIKAGYK